MIELGAYIRDIFTQEEKDNFAIFGPDESMSNRLDHVFEENNSSSIRRYNVAATNSILTHAFRNGPKLVSVILENRRLQVMKYYRVGHSWRYARVKGYKSVIMGDSRSHH